MPGLIGSVVIGFLVFLAFCGFEEATCSSKAEKMGLKSDYGPVQGCMIQVDKRWIPLESYRTIGGVE